VKFFLSPDLYDHRRGRFLASILDIQPLPANSLPDFGFVLMAGEAFQESINMQETCLSWTRQPGRCLLLLPPFKVGRLTDGLDWTIGFTSGPQIAPDNNPLVQLISQEVMYQLDGNDGSSDSGAGHYWNDHSPHTRYRKAFANSGLIAVTVLPLWSISLMEHADQVLSFLSWFSKQIGKVSSSKVAEEVKPVLMPKDNTVLVCCYGMNISSASQLTEALKEYAVPFLDFGGFDLAESFDRLRTLGFLDKNTLSVNGLVHLKSSPYWVFAEHLKGVREQ